MRPGYFSRRTPWSHACVRVCKGNAQALTALYQPVLTLPAGLSSLSPTGTCPSVQALVNHSPESPLALLLTGTHLCPASAEGRMEERPQHKAIHEATWGDGLPEPRLRPRRQDPHLGAFHQEAGSKTEGRDCAGSSRTQRATTLAPSSLDSVMKEKLNPGECRGQSHGQGKRTSE